MQGLQGWQYNVRNMNENVKNYVSSLANVQYLIYNAENVTLTTQKNGLVTKTG
jgi:hypothetical protein